ncbi:beta-galactosidase GalA [Pseudoduganella lutea]|uniref:Glycoside hydrolase family 2 protein n=1 Tax=Pseudoduganella lutea TaxID=321985 RepID=A0A4P6KS68_9BURK|nr:beta-galactosidase GalA [Pseudoduganella lutea]QBE61690.1 glycoside hydrolase family 2 protein [Pseudoduganella lutea]
MWHFFKRVLLALSLLAWLLPAGAQAPRERINIDRDWRFAYGHAFDAGQDFGHGTRAFFFAKAGYGDGPAAPGFKDAGWRRVDLPHDWAVELPFDARGNTNHGSKAIGRAFPENSVGWYRKTIDIPASDRGRRIALEFDGAYRDSVVWVNGHYLGREPSGYSGFRHDITDYLDYGGTNTIVVRVDATVEEGWFYEGAGIYRHAWLTKTAPLHVAQWGTFVKSTVAGGRAAIEVDLTVRNDADKAARFTAEHRILGPDGGTLASTRAAGLGVGAAATADSRQRLALVNPRLWSLDDPHRYVLRTTLLQDGRIVDTYDTRFGIRTVAFDPDKGFSLNGKRIKLQGTNNHQDHAGVGVALPDGLQDWRLEQLKSFGVNAYRTAHHPPTPELLDATDRLGMLVIDEHRMMGTSPEIVSQLERLVRRDRNHPSVILWSVGNEEWALEGKPLGTHLAQRMHAIVKRLDPTRRTSVAASSSGRGTSLGADVIGFNYGAQHDVDAFHRAHPDKPAAMTEEGSTLTTRGIYVDDRAKVHLNAYDRQGRPGNSLSIEEGWRRVQERDWMSGMFVWTGFDYRGETTPFGWPAISSQFGMLDTTGVLKDTAWYLKAWWRPEPMVHILPHWNWPGREGQPIDVRVYSNGDEVELLQDGRSLGRKPMVRDSHLRWSVPYAPGQLEAVAYRRGVRIAGTEVATTGAPATVHLSGGMGGLAADGRAVAVVWVNVRDREGRLVPTASDRVDFAVSGPLRIIGVGNGDPGSHEADRPAERHAFVPLSGWRTLALNGPDAGPDAGFAVAPDADMTNWRDPTQWLPPEQQPPRTPYMVLRGQFDRPRLAAGQSAMLFIDQLDPGQQVHVNGRRVTPEMVDGSPAVPLDPALLRDRNSVAYVLPTPADGVAGLFDRSAGTSRWGNVRVTTAAAPWRRSLFNGWAQVIVQSTGEAGTGTLTATAQGLAPTSLQFEVR